jgi:hypothetical protein
MPLIESTKKKTIWQNAAEMMLAGHSKAQSLAAAYRTWRKTKAEKGK